MMAVSVALLSAAVIATHAALRPDVRLNASILAENPLFWWILALSTALIGGLLLLALWRVNRGHFFRVGNALIHPQILTKELARIWAIRFPELPPPTDVWLSLGRNWHIQLNLPTDHEGLLQEIDHAVGQLMRDRFGYSGPYSLLVRTR